MGGAGCAPCGKQSNERYRPVLHIASERPGWFAVLIGEDHVVLKDDIPSFFDMARIRTAWRLYLHPDLVDLIRHSEGPDIRWAGAICRQMLA
jgi:hypothetical protein